VNAQILENERKLQEAERFASEYLEEKLRLDAKIHQLDQEIAAMEPLKDKDVEVKVKERRLIRYVADRREQVASEIARLERVAKEARSALLLIKSKEENCMRLQMAKDEIDEVHRQLEKAESDSGKLAGMLECASKIKLVDGRCPVCNSAVTKINEMFDGDHIKSESARLGGIKSKLQIEKVTLKKEEQKLVEEGRRISAAEAFLASNCIKSLDDIEKIEADLGPKKDALLKLPREIVKVDEDPYALAIDDTSLAFAEEVADLREQLKNFSMAQYTAAKDEKWKVLQKLQAASTRLGAYQKTADDLKAAIELDKSAAEKLERATELVCTLERIRSNVYNRDGPVGISLRSWALSVISKKASDYASLFNIGISRIELAEKAREIAITCYGKTGEINMDSLSGGEKVAVALALRLGIAHLMGSSKLDFVILDEPTTHLDEERRKALVKIISEAFREGAGPLSQMLIITHDSEIFEDSEVDAVFRFTMTADGSKVTRE